MRKLAFCICENKDADQLRGNRKADKHLCFRYTDSTIPLLFKYKISSLQHYCVVLEPGLCWTWSETPKTIFLTIQNTSYNTVTFENNFYSTNYTDMSPYFSFQSKYLDKVSSGTLRLIRRKESRKSCIRIARTCKMYE